MLSALICIHSTSGVTDVTLSARPLRGFSLKSEATFLAPCLASDARPLAFPAALSTAALGLGRLEDEGFRFLPTSLAVPLAYIVQIHIIASQFGSSPVF